MIPNLLTNFVFSQQTDNSALNLKAKSSQLNNSSDFKSVFDKTVNSPKQDHSLSKNVKSGKSNFQTDDSQIQYRSFRDIRTEQSINDKVSTVKETKDYSPAEELTSGSGKKSAQGNKAEEQIAILAQMLGITPGELVKIAEKLGFKAEDLTESAKMGQFIDQLGAELDLNSQQKELLVKLSQEVLNQVKATESNQQVPRTLDSELLKASESQVQSNNSVIDSKAISELVKTRLNELIESTGLQTETIGSEVSKVIAAMRAQLNNKISVNGSETTTAESNELLEKLNDQARNVNKPEDSSVLKQDSKLKDKDIEESNAGKTAAANEEIVPEVKTVSVQVNTNAEQNSQQQVLQAFSQLKQGIVNNQVDTSKSTFTMPQTIKTSDILKQVVEQTKVFIGQDKTEMVIHLKPDHLGKLELKVITEQGIVAAKFIAENQQVKEIIETNMQSLKDSLEKQGINIEGVSVQVGQDRKNEYQNNFAGNKNGTSAARGKSTPAVTEASGVRGTIAEILPERLAQYSYETNTINLTA